MGAGVPVVAARAGALPEVLGDAAVLVDPADVDGLADALDRVVHDDELRRASSARGCRRVAPYSWPTSHPVRRPVPVARMRARSRGAAASSAAISSPTSEARATTSSRSTARGTPPVDVTDAAAVREVLRAARPDVVYHLAALSHIGESWDAPAAVFRVNAEGTLNVLRACIAAGVERVLVAGSADEYGVVAPDDLPITEDSRCGPARRTARARPPPSPRAAGVPGRRAGHDPGPRVQPHRARSGASMLVPGLARRIVAAERAAGPSRGRHPRRRARSHRRARRRARVPAPRRARHAGRGLQRVLGPRLERARGRRRAALDERRALELVVDPELVRPVEVPRLVGSPARLRAVTGWEAADPVRADLARRAGRGASRLRLRAQ